jgi:hypothetical protein
MANEAHIKRLKAGVKVWNEWRRSTRTIPDLTNVDFAAGQLRKRDLSGIDLHSARLDGASFPQMNFRGADFREAELNHSHLVSADFSGANLAGASLVSAQLGEANFTSAVLSDCQLGYAVLRAAILKDAVLAGASFWETVLADLDLSAAIDLERCVHLGPSIMDHRTLRRSGHLPLSFLRGVGLPDQLISYLPSFNAQAIQYFTCFISYSTADHDFTQRLHADLQGKGVRCWFAPHDMPIGAKIYEEIDSAIRLRDKVVLILSKFSIASDWVEDEVTKAFEEERTRGQTVLFPIRLDDAVMDTNEAWAAKLRARHIGDFRRWKEHDEYQKSFARVLRDLTVKKP